MQREPASPLPASTPAPTPPAPGARAGGYAKGRERRRLILDEAVRLFGEAGYRGASLRDLAARCGLSHAGLLHHVGSKEALLLAVLEHRDEQDLRELLPAVGGAGGGAGGVEAGRAHLRALVEVVRRNASRRGIVELFTVLSAEATAAEHPAHAFFAQRYARTLADVGSAFAACGHPDPAGAAARLVALMDGLQVQWLLRPAGGDDAVDMAAQVQAQVDAELARAPQAGPDELPPQPAR